MYDLIVIGGGPAGAAAAITAVREGVRVLLLDRARFPRQKVCGEFVSSESLELLGNLLGEQHRSWLQTALRIERTRIFLDDQVLQARVQPTAASIARWDLDDALWNCARACGTEALQPLTVQQVLGSGPWVVRTSAGDFETKAVINASGRWSNLNAAPPDRTQPKWIGVKAHFEEALALPSVDLYFFDGGYCGVQAVCLRTDSGRNRINACAMVRADVASTLDEVFQRHPALRERSRQWQQLGEAVVTSPLVFRDPRPLRDGILMAGDGACFVDPFVGDGISLALRSGALAAECLVPFFREAETLAEAARNYADQYVRQFGPVFRNSSKIRRMLRIPAAVRRPVVALLGKLPVVTEYLVTKTR